MKKRAPSRRPLAATTPSPARRPHGFTLLEVMIVVALIGLLAALAASVGPGMVRQQRFMDLTREVYHALSLARFSALSEGRPGVVSFDAGRFTAFVDRSVPANFVFDTGTDKLLLQTPAAPTTYEPGVNVNPTFPNAPSTSVPTAIFNNEGFSVTSSGGMFAGTVTLTNAELTEDFSTRIVETTVGGAIRITKP